MSAICAVHPGAEATATCARCGNNVCPSCLEPESELPDLCDACREKVGVPLPWERDDGAWVTRWWRTVRDVIVRPTDTFERAVGGAWKRALAFAALVGAAQGLLPLAVSVHRLATFYRTGSLAEASLRYGETGGWVALTAPLWFAAAQICFVGLRGLLFHAGARLGGGRGGLGVSVWACGYVHATQLLGFLLTLAGLVPGVGGLLVLLGWLAIEARIALTLTTVARAQHGLSAGRATFAGWASFLGLGALGLVSCVLLSALVVAAFQAAGWP